MSITKFLEKIYKRKLMKQGLKLGEEVRFIYPFPTFSKPHNTIELGNNILISGKVNFISHDGSSFVVRNLDKELKKMSTVRKIKVGNNVFIGFESVILSGVNIGNNVIIGAKSLITKDCKDNSVYAEIPGKRICSIDEYKKKYKGNTL